MVAKLASMSSSPKMTMLPNNMSESRSSSSKHRKNMIDAVVVDVYSSEEIKNAAGEAAIAGNVINKWSSSLPRNQSSTTLAASLRLSLLSQSSDTNNVSTRHGRRNAFQLPQNEFVTKDKLQSIIHTLNTNENPCMDDDVIKGIVLSREDQLPSTSGRMTSIIKINLAGASSNPHYQPGGKICNTSV